MDNDYRQERGFTLIEVLVALVIMIGGLAAYYFVFGSSILAGESASLSFSNVRTADDMIAELGRSVPLEEGLTSGELSDGRRWRLKVESFNPVDAADPPSPLAAHLITLSVLGPGERSGETSVKTLIIGKRP